MNAGTDLELLLCLSKKEETDRLPVFTCNCNFRSDFLDEIKLMCTLSHPCTVRLYAWTEIPLAMIMELAICDLRQYYAGKTKTFGPYSYLSALEVMLDAARGLLVSERFLSVFAFSIRFLMLRVLASNAPRPHFFNLLFN